MIPPKKMTAISCLTGGRRHFKSIGDMVKQLGINRTYAVERINSGTPCKGWLLYDTDHDTSPEAREAMRRHVKGFEAKCQAKQSKREAFVSVRIDSRTTILVKASKWTPDCAERYKARLNDRVQVDNDFRLLPKVKGGRR